LTAKSQQAPSIRLLTVYYAATALFLVLDYVFAFNVRLTFLDPWPLWRAVYYGFCFLCLAMLIARPGWGLYIAVVESLLTLSLLILSMGVRVFTVTDIVLEQGAASFGTRDIINFALAGTVAWIAYFRSIRRLQQSGRL